MTKLIKKLTLAFAFFFLMAGLSAQNPPHPNGGNNPGTGNTPVGGGAPVGGGLLIMLIAGSMYAAKKTFYFRESE